MLLSLITPTANIFAFAIQMGQVESEMRHNASKNICAANAKIVFESIKKVCKHKNNFEIVKIK